MQTNSHSYYSMEYWRNWCNLHKIILMFMIAGVLREKGQTLFNSYLGLKKHLEELRSAIAGLERENSHEEEVIKVKCHSPTLKVNTC